MSDMKTSEAISIIYKSMCKTHGHHASIEHLSNIMCNVLDDLRMEGLAASAENIEKALSERAEAYMDILDSEVA